MEPNVDGNNGPGNKSCRIKLIPGVLYYAWCLEPGGASCPHAIDIQHKVVCCHHDFQQMIIVEGE